MTPPYPSRVPSDIRVAFEGDIVTIRAGSAAVRTAAASTFRWMRASQIGRDAGTIDVRKVGREFAVDIAGETRPGGPDAASATRVAEHAAIELLIAARPDLLWLHAAAAVSSRGAVVMPGRRGRGKSTLVSALWRSGWTFLTDDILPIDPDSLAVLPFPQCPAVRLDIGRDLPDADIPRIPKRRVTMRTRIGVGSARIGGIVIPLIQREGETTLTACGPGEVVLTMLEGCWNFAHQGERAVATLARLVPQLPTARLTYSDALQATALLTEWAATGFDRGALHQPNEETKS